MIFLKVEILVLREGRAINSKSTIIKTGKIISNISSYCNDKQCEVRITDNGIGISKENINKIFKIDESYSTIGTEREKGTGLGLILCKEFTEKNSGNLWVKSEPEK